jgi:hypothetical protein
VLPVGIRPAEPRSFGLDSPAVAPSIAVGLIVLGIVLVVIGTFALGVIAIVLGVCLLSMVDRVRGEADAAVESISTWSKAGRDLVRHRRQRFQLRRERDAKIRELGVSAYAEDGRADELKAAAKELDSRIEANERTIQRTLAGARRRVRKERAAVVGAEVIAPEPAEEKKESRPKGPPAQG